VTIGADRPPGATGYDELVTNAVTFVDPYTPESWADYVRRTSGFIPWPPR
jgi:hypothetical protein